MTPNRARMFLRFVSWTIAMLLASFSVLACGGGTTVTVACDKSVSVSGYVVDLSQGLDNRGESEYSQFRLDTLDVRDVVASIADDGTDADDQTRAAAMILRDEFSAFTTALENVTWDLTRASDDPTTVAAWRELITPETLGLANVVEAWIISKCGLPSRVTSTGDGPARLPDPSIPSPTATDPPTGPVNEISEQEALGEVVATLFSLTLSRSQTLCLGRQLSGVVDSGSIGTDPSRYLAQFQTAFDSCGIAFTVPAG